ncbi:DUF302 domain-containing protein [Actinospica sp. MGRD01-02]|uniref:DUF302 domain-containing protein n=1 Tax=Actinospica acidithermotolerans TaxID=2828514 RepID=A0A941EEH4_9ACTN|nr:DUF302 domain-containing protein [Actinospica acidithermotolerans]MBR7829926.1 DUF302 domain-containing protein [Actinospica acidithermotolerans]
MAYGTAVTVDRPYSEVVDQVRAALQEQGFGVLTEIDVQATLREKLGAQLEPYLILGACNPPLAHRALSADPSIGLLLPCNVVVRRQEGRTVVEALDPNIMVEVTGDATLSLIAAEASVKLNAALEAVSENRTA